MDSHSRFKIYGVLKLSLYSLAGGYLCYFNPFTLKSSSRSIVCYFHTFGNNLGIKGKFAKYFKESCCLSSDQMFSKKCFCKENISKIVRPLLATLSVNGLNLCTQTIHFLLYRYLYEECYFGTTMGSENQMPAKNTSYTVNST